MREGVVALAAERWRGHGVDQQLRIDEIWAHACRGLSSEMPARAIPADSQKVGIEPEVRTLFCQIRERITRIVGGCRKRVLGREAIVDADDRTTGVLRQQRSQHAVRRTRCAYHPAATVKPHQHARPGHVLRAKDDRIQRAARQRQAQVRRFNAVRIGPIRERGNRLETLTLGGGIFRRRQGAKTFGNALIELQDLRIDGHGASASCKFR